MSRLAVFLATSAYVGYFPLVPGTVGSAVGLAVHALVRASGGPVAEVAVIVGLYVVGVWAATRAEAFFGRADPRPVVIDEVMGMLVTLAFVPVGIAGLLCGFVLFRLFDVIKPWPTGRLEDLPGGVGVMSDDAMAGIYANLALRGLAAIAPTWVQ